MYEALEEIGSGCTKEPDAFVIATTTLSTIQKYED
tara:strand:+ start:339 stop:443 length:105 start_codon:yes stop_codon:yes gene_type:complete